MNKITDIKKLIELSYSIRKSIIKSLALAGSGHTGGSLGLSDIFTALYFHTMNHRPTEPGWDERDRLILSIGHVAPVLYTTLAHAGYFPLAELFTLRKEGSRLQGHPALDRKLPGIETSSGSLGQGLSIAVGMAIAAKSDGKSCRIFSIHGDGEMQEGQIWEAAMAAAHHKLDSITAIIDCNGLQIDGKTSDIMNTEPLADKWRAFGWNVFECDGHHFHEIIQALNLSAVKNSKPNLVIARTIMGRGVKTIENNHCWHGKAPTREEAVEFLCQLDESMLLALEKSDL